MRLALAFVVLLVAHPAQALSIIQCALGETPHGWIARAIVLAHEPGASKAIVADDLGLYYSGAPATARVTSQTASRLRFTWTIDKMSDVRGNLVSAMVYRATLRRKSGTLSVSATPLGYSANFSARGSCSPVGEAERARFRDLLKSVR